MAPNLQNMGFSQNHHSTNGGAGPWHILANRPIPPSRIREISYRDLQFEQIPITMHSSRGTKYTKWVDIGMPKISKEALDCVFYLYKNKQDAEEGREYGGTGFIVGVPSVKFPNLCFYYGITNHHV